MDELADVALLRADMPAASTHRACARLNLAIGAEAGRIAGRTAVRTRRRAARGRPLGRLAVTVAGLATLAAAIFVAVGHPDRVPARSAPARPVPAPPASWWAYNVPSQGVATSAAQPVDYATKAAARAPLFPAPKPSEWIYTEALGPVGLEGKNGTTLTGRTVVQHWQQIDSERAADSVQHGTLTFSREGTPDANLAGWPSDFRTLYNYLARLPGTVPALRGVILANDKKYGGEQGTVGAFDSILALLGYFAVPPRLQAELYGVLVSLPGVRFETSVRDGAGRTGVGLYVLTDGCLKQEIIVNPTSYGYMGAIVAAARAHTDRCTGMCWPKVTRYAQGQVLNWSAQLGEGVVQKAGEIPGR
jgi:hypothetical protein